MDPLSALNSMTSQQVNALRSDLAANAQAAKPVAASDLQQLEGTTGLQPLPPAQTPSYSFPSVLGSLVGEVAQKQADASDTVGALMSGKNVSLHQTMISMEEANVSFQMMVEVRNRLLDSYQELMRMQM